MKHRVQAGFALLACVVLAACSRGLPQTLRKQIAASSAELHQDEQQFQAIQSQFDSDIHSAPALFNGVPDPAQWQSRLHADHAKLQLAQSDQTELESLSRQNRVASRDRAQQLLAEEVALRRTALDDGREVQKAVGQWLSLSRDPTSYLAKLKRDYTKLLAVNLEPVRGAVTQAGQDWPAQQLVLNSRLSALSSARNSAEAEWMATTKDRQAASNGQLTGIVAEALVHEDQDLVQQSQSLSEDAAKLRDLCGQLYVAWDKILVDLDTARRDGQKIYREEIETVRTRFTGPGAKQSSTTSDRQWVDVSEPQFHSVENDLGMAIAHKDAGQFDSQAQTTPEPAGFAYIAPPSQGSNQYGYWTHNGGESFWTFFPQYLLLRELMWGHDYRPIVLDEYRGYRTAQSSGRTYYGRETPTSPPKYGTHGTFTERHYASSRYMQSGGFRKSEYASRSSPSTFNQEEGHQFGASRSGHRFGSLRGSSSGRRFGGMGRGFGRGFGRR
jgi:hypothetical protein